MCDSIGAIHGNDRRGITALLNSCASMCLSSMAGTPVLNIRMEARQGAVALRPLIEGFFRQGGMQVQVTCTRREELLAAQKDPFLLNQ